MAQIELRDFYSFLKNKYAFSETDAINTDKKQIDPLDSFLENNKKEKFCVDPSIDLRALANEVNEMEF